MPPFFFALDMPDLSEQIEEAAEKAKKVASGTREVIQREISELIEADKHLSSRSPEAASHPHRGLRFTKLVPPGCG